MVSNKKAHCHHKLLYKIIKSIDSAWTTHALVLFPLLCPLWRLCAELQDLCVCRCRCELLAHAIWLCSGSRFHTHVIPLQDNFRVVHYNVSPAHFLHCYMVHEWHPLYSSSTFNIYIYNMLALHAKWWQCIGVRSELPEFSLNNCCFFNRFIVFCCVVVMHVRTYKIMPARRNVDICWAVL